jgi:uncharacterized membrane protein
MFPRPKKARCLQDDNALKFLLICVILFIFIFSIVLSFLFSYTTAPMHVPRRTDFYMTGNIFSIYVSLRFSIKVFVIISVAHIIFAHSSPLKISNSLIN